MSAFFMGFQLRKDRTLRFLSSILYIYMSCKEKLKNKCYFLQLLSPITSLRFWALIKKISEIDIVVSCLSLIYRLYTISSL